MENDVFLKKLFELKSAVSVFRDTCGADGDVPERILEINGHIDALGKMWESYQSLSSSKDINKTHLKMKTKMAMFVNCLSEARKACVGSRMQKKYGGGLDYIGKKITELNLVFPRTPREGSVDLFDEMDGEKPAVGEKAPAAEAHVFQRKMAEMRACVTSFVQSYDESERKRSVVAYIGDMEMYLKAIERFWKKYVSPVRDAGVIKGMHASIMTEIRMLREYYEMSVMIAKANGSWPRYASNHEYVKKKLDELESAFPSTPRKLNSLDGGPKVIIAN
jgi:hypothetical protein